ncbi:MAG: polysaccharide biosynthesis tyrosine autokinase [Chitinispirillia bacterium]
MNKPVANQINLLRTDIKLKDYIGIIHRRKSVIILSILTVALSTVFYVYKIEDIYESFSIMVIEEKNPIMNQVMKVGGRPLGFYKGILNSQTFIELVRDSIGMEIFNNTFQKFTPTDAFHYIKDNLLLRKTEYTSFLRLNCRAKSSELAYFIASTATDLFKRRCREVESEESRAAVTEIDKQLKIIRNKLETAEYNYRTFKEQAGNILEGVPPELKVLQEAYAENYALLGLKEADLKAEKTQLSKLEKIVTPNTKGKSPEIVKLRTRLKELEKERVRLENLGIRISSTSTIDRDIKEVENRLLQYKSTSSSKPVDYNIIRQWQTLRKSVINKESEMALFKHRLISYQTAIKNYKKKNPDILSHSLELLRLKRSKEVYENIYNILLENAEEKRILSTSSDAGVKIVDYARIPESPIPKNETRYYILGIVLGCILGFGIAMVLEFNDTSLKSNQDIERHLSIPVLGTIPHIVYNRKEEIKLRRRSSKTKKSTVTTQYQSQLLNFSGDESITAEAYRSLRTNLSFVSPDNPIRTLLVTSAGPSEGKSITISNLALSYAQMGKKTLLIDTDLRRPVMHHLFGFKREPGFSDLFVANLDYTSAIRTVQKENLFILTAGMFIPNPAELIASQKMTHHIEYFKNNFDIVFFDTPPLVAVTDATLLGTKLDGVLIVVRSHKTSREMAERAMSNLNNVGVKCIGSVLNDIDLSHRYSSYGYYKYYYHYYKSKV